MKNQTYEMSDYIKVGNLKADYDVQKQTGLEFWFTPNLKEG